MPLATHSVTDVRVPLLPTFPSTDNSNSSLRSSSTHIQPQNENSSDDVGASNVLSAAATASIPANLLTPQVHGILGEYVAHKHQIDEYKDEMIQHLLRMEALGRPCLEQMEMQPEITLRMRPLLLDFLMDVINKLNLSKSTFPLTVNLIDRYASVRVVKKKHYQLLGLTALWVACKNLDAKASIPRLDDLCRYCCRCYDRTMFLEMENHLLKSLDWLVDTPTVDTFVDVFIYSLSPYHFLAGSKMSHRECTTIKIVANYLCELAHFYPQIQFGFLVPQLALGAVVMACMILHVCTEEDLPAVIEHILQECDAPILSVLQLSTLFLQLGKVSNRPPPSLKTKYFSDDPNCLNLTTILSPFNAVSKKDSPLQLATPLEPLALTPLPLGGSSPMPLTPQLVQSSNLAHATAQLLNNLTNLSSLSKVLAEKTSDASTVSTEIRPDSANGKSASQAFPLPSLLPGQGKRGTDAEESNAKRAKIA